MQASLTNTFTHRIRVYFTQGHERSLKAKKNIIASFGLKGISVSVGFLLVPMTLNYLDVAQYGLWLTISSIVGWFGFFDIGLGNGLRNKLAEALARKDYPLAKTYVSTTYVILSIIIGGVYLLFLFINPFLDWTKLLNTSPQLGAELSQIVLAVTTFFVLRFVLQLIGVILMADQRPAVNNSFAALGNLIALVAIFIITRVSKGNLLYVSLIFSAAPVMVLTVASFCYFNGQYSFLRPNMKYVSLKYFKSLAGLGGRFFVIQIACLIMFSTDNMIIAQVIGPAGVAPYNIAFKYFGISIMIFTTIVTPFWSATTEAFVQRDILWIKNTVKKLLIVWVLVVLGTIVLLAVSNVFYTFWLGDKVKIPFLLSLFMMLYVVIINWNNIFAFFLNGIGKIRLQLYYGIFVAILNIPLSIIFAKQFNLGSAGVLLATCLCLFSGSILAPLQYYKIINNKARGIWAK